MTWPVPRPGLVVRYAYLWKLEAEAGREESVKDRPCAVVLTVEGVADHPRVLVLPITHSRPSFAEDGVELPPATKARLGLDEEKSWVIVSEANSFIWPGPDLRLPPEAGPRRTAYGFLPPSLFRLIRDRFIARARGHSPGLVVRTE